MGKELPAKQKLFVQEYLKDLDGKNAYIRAGYKTSGNSAEVNAHKLLRNTKIQEEINKAMKAREKRTEITQDKVVSEYARVAFADRLEITPKEKELIGLGFLKPFDKMKALEMVGKHLGMFKEKLELSGQDNEPIKVFFNIPRPNYNDSSEKD